jgi:polyhydroxybutyrate depolymerase
MRMRRVSLVSCLAVGSLFAAVSCNGGGDMTGTLAKTGSAGTTSNGSAGTAGPSSGTAGSGTAGTGAAGDTGNPTPGSGAGGSSSTGAGGTGTNGTAGTTTPPADGGGMTTSDAGTGSTAPTGMSAGCGSAPGANDKGGSYAKHMITVSGIASTVKAATAGGSWTNRVYYLDLPTGYSPTKAYPVIFGGGGCGGALDSNGNGGGFAVLPQSNANAIQIGMSYVWPQGGGACFSDDGADTPDLPYFDAILKEVESNYCVDKGKVFVGGYSSGGWEAYMLGLARGGIVRGISTAAGGLRMSRPSPSGLPIAALLLTGGDDNTNPATGPTGSDLAMNLILQTNKCTGTDTMPWATTCAGCGCIKYTGCPDAYPVVRCRPPGQGHTDGGGAFKTAIWSVWSTLP